MQTKNHFSLLHKIFHEIVLLGMITFTFGMGDLTSVRAQTVLHDGFIQISGHVLSDGQFVYGPNIGDFKLKTYLASNAPHLSDYADGLYGRAEYFSMNPKIYLTLLEIHSQVLSNPNTAATENPFGLNAGDFMSQIEYLSDQMIAAYYLHIYSYSRLPVSQRSLEPFVTPGGITVDVAPDTNAGTYAIIAGLAAMDEQDISLILDNSQKNGFYQTYRKLFGNDDPLDESNHIYIPGVDGVLAIPRDLSSPPGADEVAETPSAPANLLQLPYLRGLSWNFGGVHNNTGGTTFTDASSMDFYPNGSVWGMDTSNMWVVAAASGIPTRFSDCGYKVSHSGAVNVGWETTYYHLEGAKFLSGSINQNTKIGIIANTEAEATCTGGSATGPHVHFSLKYNGAFVPINGTALSGWTVHSGRYSYDVDPNYMWLIRGGIKKYAYQDLLLSEATAPPVSITGNAGVAGVTLNYTDEIPKIVSVDSNANYSISVQVGWSGTVTPTHPCYTFNPPNSIYNNVSTNQTVQNYAATLIPGSVCVLSILRAGSNPTSSNSVDFTVVFSKAMTGVNAGDFVLTTTGVTGASISNVSGLGTTYTVTVNTGTGNGTIRLDLVDDDTIVDGSNNPLGGVGAGNGDFSSGEVYDISKEKILNGGFNIYPTGKKIPTNWKAVNFSTSDGKSTTVKKEGMASVVINGTGISKTLSQTIVLNGSAGDAFNFSYWVKGSAIPTAGVCRAQILFYNGATLKPTKKTVNCGNGTYAFKQRLLSFTAPGNFTKIVIRFTYGKASGKVWFDNVSLMK